MIGSHIIKTVGVLIFRPDKTVSINLNEEFLQQMDATSDELIYQLVKQKVDQYVQASPRFEGENHVIKAKYITMAIFAHYLKKQPQRKGLRTALRLAAG